MTIRVTKDGTPYAFDGTEAVDFFRMNALLQGMKFELKTGMKMTRGPSCFTLVRKEYGLKGSKEKLIAQFEVLVAGANSGMVYKRDA